MRSKIRSVVISSLFFLIIALGTARGVIHASFKAAANASCRLVGEHYFRAREPRVLDWVKRCEKTAEHESFLLEASREVERINRRLDLLEVSHLTLYSPTENRQIWENESLDTGLRARVIDGRMVVYDVLEGGSGEARGIHAGDIVLSVDQREIHLASEIQSLAGHYEFERDGKKFAREIVASELTENLAPYLEAVALDQPQVGLLRIPSFLAPYFAQQNWQELASRLNEYSSLIIDLRGNVGGSFPAMLRALSPFRCDTPKIGTLYHANNKHQPAVLPDDLDANLQLSQLGLSDEVELRAFKNYGCYRRDVTVLIDRDTSSVAEIFTNAFLSRAHSRVWGQPSAGQVVMAQWFPISALGGDDYSLSIPIAGYRSLDGTELESQALQPQRLLSYDLDRAKAGRDSWLEDALDRRGRD